MSLVGSISEAIARMEGFFKEGSISQKNGNPGNLRSWGKRPVINGYAAFLRSDGTPDPASGWAALNSQVRRNIERGLTLQEFFAGKPGVYGGFSPASDHNQPLGYAVYVAGQVKIPIDVPLNTLPETGV